MSTASVNEESRKPSPYLSASGAWALAFGCSVGWGAFVMPGTTFLPIGGPIGTALGLGIGGLVMLVLSLNYHYLMNHFPDGGGTYTYTKNCFGYDQGFLAAWFLVLVYFAILWANATALPLIVRTLFGGLFQFGFEYEIAGYHIYLGELLLAIGVILIAAWICLHRRAAAWIQLILAVGLFGGITVCFFFALSRNGINASTFTPAFAPGSSPLGGTFTIFALAPWAYVGFESISHSTAEAKFSLKRSFPILAAAVIAAAMAYIFLVLMAVTALPEGCSDWTEYTQNLGSFSGVTSQPAFYAAQKALSDPGLCLLGIAAVCGIMTGLIGNYIALSRLLCSLSKDGMLPKRFGELDQNKAPRRAILYIMGASLFLPFFGRTAISWIVDVTTVGATIAYAFASAAAWKLASKEKSGFYRIVSAAGFGFSVLFALEFLIPNLLSVTTLSMESYLILAAWGILGFLYFRFIFRRDDRKRFGRSIFAWVILFSLILFTSSVWMLQSTRSAIQTSVAPIHEFYLDKLEEAGIDLVSGATQPTYSYLEGILKKVDRSARINNMIQAMLIIAALLILFDIYVQMQKREKQAEVEKALAEESSRAKTSFLSNMSHEIRTPMNAIIGLGNIALRDPELSPRARECLNKIEASARHLLGLINDILDMSRIESGRMVLKNEEFSFKDLLDQVNIMINGQCADKKLLYDCKIIGKVSDYYIGDDMKLKQVLINILGNSGKFTDPPGEVSLTVEQTAQFEGLCTLRFSMRDTGVGMDPEYIPRIFEAFSQEDEAATNRYGGSGLGMAITKSFVDMMNGEIRVESQKGVGSLFTVSVTLKASSRSVHLDHSMVLPKNLRALVVDDDLVACEHAQVVLRSIGIESDTFTDPQKALARFTLAKESGEAYQLVLTDYRMPQTDGIRLAGAIRAEGGEETAILMLTGYDWEHREEEIRQAGIDGILAKPLFSDNLQRTILSVFEHKNPAFAKDAAAETETTEAGEREAEAQTKDDGENGVTHSLAGRRILMAEDVDLNAEILADLLDLEDILSERANNGEQAVEMFSKSPPGYYDAILMDVRMPVMDGLSATRAIRSLEHPDARSIPIIAMTANAFEEDVERSLQAGMNAHLSKPIEPERLYSTMMKMIA